MQVQNNSSTNFKAHFVRNDSLRQLKASCTPVTQLGKQVLNSFERIYPNVPVEVSNVGVSYGKGLKIVEANFKNLTNGAETKISAAGYAKAPQFKKFVEELISKAEFWK